jgi:hypothetical protein
MGRGNYYHLGEVRQRTFDLPTKQFHAIFAYKIENFAGF